VLKKTQAMPISFASAFGISRDTKVVVIISILNLRHFSIVELNITALSVNAITGTLVQPDLLD
jgi:hypothetical protein